MLKTIVGLYSKARLWVVGQYGIFKLGRMSKEERDERLLRAGFTRKEFQSGIQQYSYTTKDGGKIVFTFRQYVIFSKQFGKEKNA